MKIGFTGSRYRLTVNQGNSLKSLLAELMPIEELHHGDCIIADSITHTFADALAIKIIIHPPEIDEYRAYNGGANATILPPKPYLQRNWDIVDAVDMLIACPKEGVEQIRSGTWATVRYARKWGIPVTIIYPSGEVQKK